MPGSGTWRPLPLEPPSLVPNLLCFIETGTSDYTVRITDTANLWVESLEYKAIRGRGLIESTSIDPSDSPENMAMLLSCLRAALDPSHKDHHQTSVSLSRAPPSDAGEGGLTVKVTCWLPGLEPLVWPIHLRKASSSSISTALVLPLIQEQHARAREIESLAAMLSHKDAVITKLLDKLEANGTGLEHIFNQLNGKKKITRSAAGSKVKGLAPFDRQQWQNDLDSQDSPYSVGTLLQEVFEGNTVKQQPSLDNEDSSKLDRWWLDLKGTLQVPQRAGIPARQQAASSPAPLKHNSPTQNGEDDEDDDFQMQETPPHLVTRSKGQHARDTAAADDASTDSDDDELMPSQPVSHEARSSKTIDNPAPKPSMGRMGAIGGKKTSPPKSSASPVKAKSVEKEGDGSDTASDLAENDNDDNETASTASNDPTPPPSPPRKTTAPKGRMGQIGGRTSKQPVSAKGDEAPKAESSSHTHKLGTVGKAQASKPTDQTTHTDLDGRGRHSTRESSKEEVQPRETSTERADRRRAELKKELERKAAAGPAKKKRKF